jgi:hypothetical protein
LPAGRLVFPAAGQVFFAIEQAYFFAAGQGYFSCRRAYFFSRLKLTRSPVGRVYNRSMSTIIVYADLVFGVNLVMDWLVLWIAGRLTGRPGERLWLAAAAVLGAFYALAAALWPYSIFAAGWLKPLAGCLLAAVAYRPKHWLGFWRYCGAFYLVSFALGGAAFGLWYLLLSTTGLPDNLGRYAAPSVFALPLGVLIMVGLLLADRRQKRRLAMNSWLAVLELWSPAAGLGQETAQGPAKGGEKEQEGRRGWQFTAFLDTGHQLRDTASGLPVLVTTVSSLPEPWARAISATGWQNLERLSLRTVAGGEKTLPIWGPLELRGAGVEKRECMLALTPELLDREGKYQMLAPFELAEYFCLPRKQEKRNHHESLANHY